MSDATLTVQSATGPYAVTFHASTEEALEAAALAAGDHAMFIVDRNVADAHAAAVARACGTRPRLELEAQEETKTPAGVERIARFVQENDGSRRTVLVVVGGGIVQDVASLTAHLFYRGISWIFVPTTLLAMADSCIGSKCGVNVGPFKNQLGAFHPPRSVHLATTFAATLTDGDVRSGYGEIAKLLLIRGDGGLDRLDAALAKNGLRGSHLAPFVREALEIKRVFIEEDEHENGRRVILNYGHTFGHALEAVTHYAVPHGAAVAWGLDLANYLAMRWGKLPTAEFDAVHAFVRRRFSVPELGQIGADSLLDAVRRDKKASDGVVRFVLLARPGEMLVERVPLDAALRALVVDYLQEHHHSEGQNG